MDSRRKSNRRATASGAMNVCLVVPRYADRVSNVAQTTIGPPLGLAYMAAVLERRGVSVTILDGNALGLSDRDVVASIADKRPDVVGLTAVTPTADQCGRIARAVREQVPGAFLVMGGMHPTAVPKETLERYPALDAVVRGEADTRLAELVEGLADGRSPGDFAGVGYRADGAIVVTDGVGEPENLDALPLPARHLLPMDRYVGPDGDRFTTIVGARGCPNHCVYCSVNQAFGGRLRLRDPERVAEEISECGERYGTRTFGFVDDTFTTSRQWVEGLCDAIIRRGLPSRARWFCLTRVDRVDRALLQTMKRAGCFKVEFGIESGDQAVLDSLEKGTTTEQVLQAFRWARETGLRTFAFVMLFSPAETVTSLQATRRLVFRADPDYLQASFCTPYPGTPLAERCAREGVEVSADWSEYVFLRSPVMSHPRFSRREMLGFHKRFLRSFYLRPRTVFRLLRHVLESGGWRGFLRTVFGGLRMLGGRGA